MDDQKPDLSPLGPLDSTSDTSIIALLPEPFRHKALTMPSTLNSISYDDLSKEAFSPPHGKGEPDSISIKLRFALWREYDRCLAEDERLINLANVCRGICSPKYFEASFATYKRVAWLLMPPKDPLVELQEIYDIGLHRMKEVMLLKPEDHQTRWGPNVKLMDLQFKIMQSLENRLLGAVIQRVDERKILLSYNQQNASGGKRKKLKDQLGPGNSPPQLVASQSQKVISTEPALKQEIDEMQEVLSMEEIDRRMKELELQSAMLSTPNSTSNLHFRAKGTKPVIDVPKTQ